MAPVTLTPEILTVLAVLSLTILLFVFEWVRVDVVGLLMMVSLPLLGLVEASEAISGLSSNAVVSIIAVIIMGAGLDRTGVMHGISRRIVKMAGRSELRIMSLIAGTVAVISSFMQNIGAAALFLPTTQRICRQLGLPISRILIPMGYAAVIGGCLTLVGSSPLILLNDLMGSWWTENTEALGNREFVPYGFFSVSPIGIALVIAVLVYFIVFGKWLLPARGADACAHFMDDALECTYGPAVGTIHELVVPSSFTPRTLETLKIRPTYHATVVCICKMGRRKRVVAPSRTDIIEPGNYVGVVCTPEKAKELARDLNWRLFSELDTFSEELTPDNAGAVEAVITPRSELAGTTLSAAKFRKRYLISPLAIYRRNRVMLENISETKLQPGDALLLFGQWEKLALLKEKPDFAFTQHIKGETTRPDRAVYAVGWLAVALSLALIFNVTLSIALLTGAVGMILTRVLSIDEAYGAVDWMTVFLLAGLIPLGIAFQKTGAAHYLAVSIIGVMGEMLTPLTLLLILCVVTSFFTLVASNVGATVLLVPLAMNMAVEVGMADVRMAALAVGVCASNTFILPTHQVNALIMRPGGYRIIDYVRAGTGMTLLFIAVVMGMAWLAGI